MMKIIKDFTSEIEDKEILKTLNLVGEGIFTDIEDREVKTKSKNDWLITIAYLTAIVKYPESVILTTDDMDLGLVRKAREEVAESFSIKWNDRDTLFIELEGNKIEKINKEVVYNDEWYDLPFTQIVDEEEEEAKPFIVLSTSQMEDCFDNITPKRMALLNIFLKRAKSTKWETYLAFRMISKYEELEEKKRA